MRRRLLLIALVAAAAATAGGVLLGGAPSPPDAGIVSTPALARAEMADVPVTPALSRVRDDLGRDHGARRDLAAALGIALVLTLAGGWWIGRERAARVLHARPPAVLRTRAPPGLLAIVHCR